MPHQLTTVVGAVEWTPQQVYVNRQTLIKLLKLIKLNIKCICQIIINYKVNSN